MLAINTHALGGQNRTSPVCVGRCRGGLSVLCMDGPLRLARTDLVAEGTRLGSSLAFEVRGLNLSPRLARSFVDPLQVSRTARDVPFPHHLSVRSSAIRAQTLLWVPPPHEVNSCPPSSAALTRKVIFCYSMLDLPVGMTNCSSQETVDGNTTVEEKRQEPTRQAILYSIIQILYNFHLIVKIHCTNSFICTKRKSLRVKFNVLYSPQIR